MAEFLEELINTQEIQNNVNLNLTEAPRTQYKNNVANIFSLLDEKLSPEDLSDTINNSGDGIGAALYILNIDGDIELITNNFILLNMQFQYKERAQLLETFNAATILLFGDSVPIYTFQCAALDYTSQKKDEEYRYFHNSSLLNFYNKYLRATKLIESRSIAVLSVNNHTIYGYPLSFTTSYNSLPDNIGQFSMTWVVVKHPLTYYNIIDEKKLKFLILPRYNRAIKEQVNLINTLIKNIDNIIYIKLDEVLKSISFAFNIIDNKLPIITYADKIAKNVVIEANVKSIINKKIDDIKSEIETFHSNLVKNIKGEGNSIILKKYTSEEELKNLEYLSNILLQKLQTNNFNTSDLLLLQERINILQDIKTDLINIKRRLLSNG